MTTVSRKISVSGTVGINQGGTNSTTVAGARANLDLYATGQIDGSRNAAASRQGWTWNGQVFGALATLPTALGTSDWTAAVRVAIPASNPADYIGIFHLATARADGTAYELFLSIYADGALRLLFRGSNSNNYAMKAGQIVSTYGGRTVTIAITRTGATIAIYVDNVALALSDITAGTPPLWSASMTGTLLTLGLLGDGNPFTGTITPLGIANRVLSASELTALFYTGAFPASDYGSAINDAGATVAATNNSLVTGNNSTFGADTGYWVNSGGGTISGGVANIAAGGFLGKTIILSPGKRYTITGTVAGGALNVTNLDTVTYGVLGIGTSTISFIATAANGTLGTALGFQNLSGSNANLDNLTIICNGLLIAPEANPPGNGYQWKDQSGNLADLTRPVAGVAWALPDARPNTVRGTLTWAGGDHAAKSLLGQRAIPDGAVISAPIRKATAASSGTGCTIGTTNSASRWQAAATFSANVKAVGTLANALPAGTADADTDVIVMPDSANFTGSIAVEIPFQVTLGT